MKNNKISIVIPSYNQGKYIEATILSIINQKYSNKEIIIIDGGSNDDTISIIKKYEDYIFYWVSENDNGQSHAIEKGFKIATGDIYCWLNSDDEFLPNTLEIVNNTFEKYKCDVVYGNMNIINEDGKLISKRYLTPFLPKIIRNAYIIGGFGIYQPSSFWTKELYVKVGGINPGYRFCMDNELFNKFVLNNAFFKFKNVFFSNFRVHGQSKTSTISNIAIKESEVLYKEMQKKINVKYPKLFKMLAQFYKIFNLLIFGNIIAVIYYKKIHKYKWVP